MAAPKNPVIPGSKTDRTGSTMLLRRAVREIRRRFDGLAADVRAVFASIRVLQANDLPLDGERTIYAMTPEEMAATSQALREALDRWIAAGTETAWRFWWAPFDEEASQLGAAQSAANLANLSTAYAAARDLRQIIFSEPYRNRVGMAQIRSYDYWTGLSGQMRSELSQVIGRAVIDGMNPRDAVKDIMSTLDVSKKRAQLYAQTDITGTLREARWSEADYATEKFGLNIALLWTSALLPTTRPTHAARNGKVYTSRQVKDFYAVDGNRFRCFLPGTLVQGRFCAGIKSRYKGPAVRLMTAAGRQLAVTANHPVLTAAGMVPAAEVREGDKLVAYGLQPEVTLGVAALNRGLTGTRVEDAFGSLVKAGHQRTARVTPVDLHGDARFAEPDVNVVDADRELVFALDAAAAQFLDDLALVATDAARPRVRAGHRLGMSDLAETGNEVRGSDVLPSLGLRHARHARALGIAAAAHFETEIRERSLQSSPIDASASGDRQQGLSGHVRGMERSATLGGLLPNELVHAEPDAMECFRDGALAKPDTLCDRLDRLAGLATLDEVVSVTVFQYAGHVFDLQERSGLLIADGIVASNCHCAQTECLLDESGKPILTKTLRATMAKEKAAWEKAHAAG